MIIRSIKWGVVAASAIILVGGFLFGRDLRSYLYSSARSVRTAVKESVPVEFELQRARDLIEDMLPELRANVRVIAEEEVEVAHLRREIAAADSQLAAYRRQVAQLRDRMETHQVSYRMKGRELTRQQLAERLSHSFDRLQQAQAILTSKQALLETRERSLAAAQEVLDRTKARKSQLEQKIEALVAQHRLVKAQSVGTQVAIDNSRLTRADKLLTEIQKRLDTAQRVLAHEADILADPPLDPVSEAELLAEVDAVLGHESEVDTIAEGEGSDDDLAELSAVHERVAHQ